MRLWRLWGKGRDRVLGQHGYIWIELEEHSPGIYLKSVATGYSRHFAPMSMECVNEETDTQPDSPAAEGGDE